MKNYDIIDIAAIPPKPKGLGFLAEYMVKSTSKKTKIHSAIRALTENADVLEDDVFWALMEEFKRIVDRNTPRTAMVSLWVLSRRLPMTSYILSPSITSTEWTPTG